MTRAERCIGLAVANRAGGAPSRSRLERDQSAAFSRAHEAFAVADSATLTFPLSERAAQIVSR